MIFMALAFLVSATTATGETINSVPATHLSVQQETNAVQVGAAQFNQYIAQLEHKNVSLVVNQSALVNSQHLVDALIERNINIISIMSPEHGFRGNKGAGEKIADETDPVTGIPIHSLYGKTKKPTPKMLQNVDVIVFDLQDVGVRFYTYLSTLHYVLEAAASASIPVILLDRPNPNGAYTDGPVLAPEFSSFVGMHPIPVLHGMTLGELALMIKGEAWINNAKSLQLTVIPVANYNKTMHYHLPVAPSPNLPNDNAIALYPTLCFFEGTAVSVGRGTQYPFQLIGHPDVPLGTLRIDVMANSAALNPKHQNKTLYARRLTHTELAGLNIELLLDTYAAFKHHNEPFFTRPEFFDKLAGTDRLRKDIIEDKKNAAEIRAGWQAQLNKFIALRQPYLLYPTHNKLITANE